MEKYKKSGVSHVPAAAYSIIEDSNSEKIRFVLLYFSRTFA